MAKSQSLALRQTKGPARAIISSQFCTKPQAVALTPTTSLVNKTALLTGATTGLGLHAARHLLSLQLSRLIIAVRSPSKGDVVAAELRSSYPSATVEVWPLEMSSYTSIQALVSRVRAEFSGDKRLDIAILNAGVLDVKFTPNKETGNCNVVQVNYLSTVLLATLLMPILRAKGPGEPGRLSIVGSGTALAAPLSGRDKRPFLKGFDEKSFDVMGRYSDSKLLGHMWMVKLMEHLPDGLEEELVVNIVDPGYCRGSGLHREASGVLGRMVELSKVLMARSLDDGAWTYVDAVVKKGKESQGCFVMDWEIRPFAPVVHTKEGEAAMDALWEETMEELKFAGVSEILEALRK
ncbi:hypothetical protein OQA88_1840 [Cercophora sp. LCS_1]